MCSAFKTLSSVAPRVTSAYVELALPLDQNTALMLYYLPRSNHTLWVATCWDECFERFFHRPNSREVLQQRLQTWPTLGVLLLNGLRQDYARGALVRAKDCDTQVQKWLLVCEVTEVNLTDAATLFGPATQRATELVKARSLQLRQELRSDFFTPGA